MSLIYFIILGYNLLLSEIKAETEAETTGKHYILIHLVASAHLPYLYSLCSKARYGTYTEVCWPFLDWLTIKYKVNK